MPKVRLMVMARWSEPKVLCTCQVAYGRMEAEANETLGGGGLLVVAGEPGGFSVLSTPYVELLMWFGGDCPLMS